MASLTVAKPISWLHNADRNDLLSCRFGGILRGDKNTQEMASIDARGLGFEDIAKTSYARELSPSVITKRNYHRMGINEH